MVHGAAKSTFPNVLFYHLQSSPRPVHHALLMVLSTVLASFYLFCVLQILFDSSVQKAAFQCPMSVFIVQSDMAFSLQICHSRIPASHSCLFTVDADFKQHALRYLSSCLLLNTLMLHAKNIDLIDIILYCLQNG